MKRLLVAALAVAFAVLAGSCGGSGSAISAGNIANFGYVLIDGSDIYFTKVILTDGNFYGNIYRYNTVTKSETLVAETIVSFPNEMNAFLSIHNGYLYFLPYFLHDSIQEAAPNIYRVRLDSGNVVPELIFEFEDGGEASITFMQIIDGTLYYYDDVESTLFSLRLGGARTTAAEIAESRTVVAHLEDMSMERISISGHMAYFSDFGHLRSLNLRTGAIADIFYFGGLDELVDVKSLIADGDFIYYLCDDGMLIGRIRTNGRDNEIIYISLGEYIRYFNISGDTIFMVVDDYGYEEMHAVLAVSTGGGPVREVVRPSEMLIDILPVSIWGDTLYFSAVHIEDTILGSEYVWYTVRRGGGTLAPFRPFNVYDAGHRGVTGDIWDDWDDLD